MGEKRENYRLGRHRGIYTVIFKDPQGNRRIRSLSTSDRGLAETRLIAFKREATAPVGRLTVGEIYAEYLADRQREGSQSVDNIGFAWRRLRGSFSHLRPGDITPQGCELYYTARRKSVGTGTVRNELLYLRAALRFGEKQGWYQKAPFIQLPRPPPPRDKRLTREEARRLIDATKVPHVRLFIVLALTTAGRAGALCELTWDRVDFNLRRVALHNPRQSETNKGRALVPMNSLAYSALKEAQANAISNYVIEWGGRKIESVRRAVRDAGVRAGIKDRVTPHMLRHTAACLMAEDRVPLVEISKFLGHRNSKITEEVYLKYTTDYLQKAARALEI